MRKIFYAIIFIFLLVGITLLLTFKQDVEETISVRSTKTINNWIISIPKIGLEEIISLSSIKSNDINGVVLFKEYGRPNEKYSNTIIGAHSGIGPNAYFNDIDKLDIGNELIIYYERVYFTYEVVKKYQVEETDLSPLNKEENKTLLTLITCNKNNSKKRVIVVSEQL